MEPSSFFTVHEINGLRAIVKLYLKQNLEDEADKYALRKDDSHVDEDDSHCTAAITKGFVNASENPLQTSLKRPPVGGTHSKLWGTWA